MSTLTTPPVIDRMTELVHRQSAPPLQPMGGDTVGVTTALEDQFWRIAEELDLCYGGVLTAGRSTLFRLSTWVAVDLAFRSRGDMVTRDILERAITASAEFLIGAEIGRREGANWHPEGDHDRAFEVLNNLGFDNVQFCAQIDGAPITPVGGMIVHNPVGVNMAALERWRNLIEHGIYFKVTDTDRPSCCGLQDCVTEAR